MKRRTALKSSLALCAAAAAGGSLAGVSGQYAPPPRSQTFSANGNGAIVTTTTIDATNAALDTIKQGGNATDAYIAAALVQCVVEHGSTSLCGAFTLNVFDAKTGKTHYTKGPVKGLASKDYGNKYYNKPEALTGKGMSLPGFVDGMRAAHEHSGHLPWSAIFDKAIFYARNGFALGPRMYTGSSRSEVGCRYPEGRAIWMTEGRYIQPGELVRQPELAKTLEKLATQGAEYFYEGEFAKHFVDRAQALGGSHTLADMRSMFRSATVAEALPQGHYRGGQIVASDNAMAIYALHLAEAADLGAMGACDSPEAVYTKFRIVEEIFHSSAQYNAQTHQGFVDADFARARIDKVLGQPLRPTNFDMLFKTNFIIIKDSAGNVAWSTHTINSPRGFGAGIIVDGVYASFIMNADHARGNQGAANGIMSNLAFYQQGRPRFIAGSPGGGFFHGPFQVMTHLTEFGMTVEDAVKAPRFGFGSGKTFGMPLFEGDFPEDVFAAMSKRGIDVFRASPSGNTGIVGAMHLQSDGNTYAAQDTRFNGHVAAL